MWNGSQAVYRRECLDHIIVVSERHLKRVLTSYIDSYHRWHVQRTCRSVAQCEKYQKWAAYTTITSGGRHDGTPFQHADS
jgi:hypothetical protein